MSNINYIDFFDFDIIIYTMRGKIKIIFICIFIIFNILFSAKIKGIVFSVEEEQPIYGCNVIVKDTVNDLVLGDMTDTQGEYFIDKVPIGEYMLIASMIGYKPDTMIIIINDNDEIIKRDFSLYISNIQLEGVNVTGERSIFINDISISKSTYNKLDMQMEIGFIEADVMRSFQLLPSVVAISDFSSALYVRGGAPDQNLILLDNIPIFNPFHIGGILSTFDINTIQDASMYAGGFEVDYGNRLSSIIDINTIQNSKEKINIKTDISLISSKFFIESSFYNFNMFLSARRTYFDKILKLFNYHFPYYFYDLMGGIQFDFNNKSYVKLTGFHNTDALNLFLDDTVEIANIKWGNNNIGLQYTYIPNKYTDFNLTVYYSNYKNNMQFRDILKIHSYVFQYGGLFNIQRKIDNHNISAGMELYRDSFDYFVAFFDTNTIVDYQNNPYYISSFINYKFQNKQRFIINAGLRLNKYELISNYYIAPRVSFKYFLNNDIAFTISAGKYYQFITSIKQESEGFSSIFGESWLPIPKNFSPQECNQFIFGYEQWFNKDIVFSIETYRKNYNTLIYSTMEKIIENMDTISIAFEQTSGYSKGIELMLKRDAGNMQGWIGYSYSQVKMLRDSAYVYPYYDKTHSLIVNITYKLPYKMAINCIVNYGTGLPYTATIGKYPAYNYNVIEDDYQIDDWNEVESEFNMSRFPPYKRVDIGVYKHFNIGYVKMTANLNIINVFNFKNVYFYYYDHSTSPSTRHEFTMLPFLPTIGVSGEF